MAEVITRCIKCKGSLLAADKLSKLLPCLHTMCEECISGRTDVVDKIRRIKEEREKSISESVEKNETAERNSNCNQAAEPMDLMEGEASENKPQSENEALETSKSKTDGTNLPFEEPTKIVGDGTCVKTSENHAQIYSESDSQIAQTESQNTEKSDIHTAAGIKVKKINEEGLCLVESHLVTKKQHDEPMITMEDVPLPLPDKEEPLPKPVPLQECPVCREPFTQDCLIENVFIRKKVVAADDEEGKELTCTGCESNQASSYCLQCDDWLCSDCVNAHKRVRMTKDHQLTTKEEAADVAKKGESSVTSEVDMLCRLHPKEKLTLFCEKCEVLTCRDCQLLQHQEHKYQFLQEAADSYKAKLTGSLSLMKERRDVLKKYQTEIEERLNKVRREKDELQQEILKQADTIVKAVRSAVWQVLSSLHSFTDAAAKRLSREVGDVGDLVGKFEHCIAFMDGILVDGYGLPLLFSKSLVETKCRKVYHTHMEPQSLKGQLNIQYRHDVQTVLRSLPNIGAIYVNGSKYPPEKSSNQTSPNTPNAQQSAATYRSSGSAAPNVVVGSATSGSLPHHLAPQDRTAYMQMLMNRQSHVSGSAQGPALTLPGSRRMSGIAPQLANAGSSRAWPSQLLPGIPVSMSGVMGQGQAAGQPMMTQRSAPFSPMRLHHRPMDQNHLVTPAPPMVLGGPTQPHRIQPLGISHLPAPPPLRAGQPLFREAESDNHSSGAQSALSGLRRSAVPVDSTVDLARPASGHNTPERPLSSEGGASSVRVKSEPNESMDCVITSANFKGKKSPVMTASLGELQKNLDEVIRGVPLDLGDNLEQINGDSLQLSNTRSTTLLNTSRVPSPLSDHLDPVSKSLKDLSPIVTSGLRSKSTDEWNKSVKSPDPASAHSDNQEHQVKGMTTGNSMPGFSMEAAEAALADPNDDYCAVCHQGGDVLCCDKCPRVFHLNCHVPPLPAVPAGAFVCTLCEPGLVLEHEGSPGPDNCPGKRKAPTGLSDRDLKVCERILLELFCHPSSIPFHEPVNRAVPNYYRIITNPMDFTTIKCKLSRNHFNHYSSVEAFIDDCRLVFRNCSVYNSEGSEVGKAGRKVHETFNQLIEHHMPEYSCFAGRKDSFDGGESDRKKRKMTPPPLHKGSHFISPLEKNEEVDGH